jgi:hypothetical protein
VLEMRHQPPDPVVLVEPRATLILAIQLSAFPNPRRNDNSNTCI